LPRAAGLAAELQKQYPDSVIELRKGSGGAFEIKCDGELIFSRLQQGRFPEPGEIVKKLRSDQQPG